MPPVDPADLAQRIQDTLGHSPQVCARLAEALLRCDEEALLRMIMLGALTENVRDAAHSNVVVADTMRTAGLAATVVLSVPRKTADPVDVHLLLGKAELVLKVG